MTTLALHLYIVTNTIRPTSHVANGYSIVLAYRNSLLFFGIVLFRDELLHLQLVVVITSDVLIINVDIY